MRYLLLVVGTWTLGTLLIMCNGSKKTIAMPTQEFITTQTVKWESSTTGFIVDNKGYLLGVEYPQPSGTCDSSGTLLCTGPYHCQLKTWNTICGVDHYGITYKTDTMVRFVNAMLWGCDTTVFKNNVRLGHHRGSIDSNRRNIFIGY